MQEGASANHLALETERCGDPLRPLRRRRAGAERETE
jgi:hypothetical protein